MEKVKILLVDDETDFLEIMGTVIRGWDYELTAVSSGREALKAVKEGSPDIVILDYVMPDMDGITTLKRYGR